MKLASPEIPSACRSRRSSALLRPCVQKRATLSALQVSESIYWVTFTAPSTVFRSIHPAFRFKKTISYFEKSLHPVNYDSSCNLIDLVLYKGRKKSSHHLKTHVKRIIAMTLSAPVFDPPGYKRDCVYVQGKGTPRTNIAIFQANSGNQLANFFCDENGHFSAILNINAIPGFTSGELTITARSALASDQSNWGPNQTLIVR